MAIAKNANKKAVVYPNAENDPGFEMAKRVAGIFEESGWDTALYAYPDAPKLDGVEMLVTFGGDGTILHAARAASGNNVPVLGINMGGKGFIAELEHDDISLIKKAAMGDYSIETRMMIDVEITSAGETVSRDFALNDAVIKGDNKVIEMNICADGQKIMRCSGDGAVIATPTGSTAYSMSAGGPIVEPTAKNIIVTPICAHILEAKSFVLTANRVVTIETVHKKAHPAYLSVDGGDHIRLEHGHCVKVSLSGKKTSLARVAGKSFYHRLSTKLISHTY